MLWGLGFWGRNSIKNHSLTLLDINLCIKPGLNTFSPPPRQVNLFKVMVYVYLGGGTKARICRTTWTDSKWHPVPRSVMVFLFQSLFLVKAHRQLESVRRSFLTVHIMSLQMVLLTGETVAIYLPYQQTNQSLLLLKYPRNLPT